MTRDLLARNAMAVLSRLLQVYADVVAADPELAMATLCEHDVNAPLCSKRVLERLFPA